MLVLLASSVAPRAQETIALDTITVGGQRPVSTPVGLDAYRTPGDAPGGLTRAVTSGGILGSKRVVDTPFSVTGFTDKLIRDQQAQVATDILRNDASVTVQNTLGSFADQLYIRGFEVALTDRLYDGAQVGYLNKFALEGIQRIEVLKGSSAVLFGVSTSQGIGGIINFVPKRALPFDYTSVTASYVAPGYVGTNVDVSRRGGERDEFGLRFNGAFNDGTLYSGTSLRHELAQINLDYAPSDRVRLYADFVYAANFNDRDQLPFTLLPGVPVPRAIRADRNYAQRWNYTDNPGSLGYVRAEVDLSDAWTLSAHYRHSFFGNNYFAVIPTIGDATGHYSLFPFRINSHIEGDGGQLNLRGRFDTGFLRHEASVGVDVENDRIFTSTPAFGEPLASSLFNPVYYPRPDLQTGSARLSNDTLVRTGYATDLITLPGGAVQILGGVRYVDILSANVDTALGTSTARTSQDRAVPLAALLLHPTPDTLLYASYAQGFQRGSIAPANAVNANAALPPIPSEQVEAGAKAEFAGLIATVAAFRIERSLEYVDAATQRFVQSGLQVHSGLEASLAGEVSPGVRLLASVMALDPVAQRTGDPLTDGRVPIGVPRFQSSLYGEVDLPFERGLTLTGGLYYVGSQYVDLLNTQRIPAWARVDLGLRYRRQLDPTTLATLRLGVENAADHRYYASAASGLGLGAPRTFKVALQVEW
ncbi:TonB-dependent receptor [Methylobacterium crusticola]|uniref:TonB-dependent receptor n=1 Tax=Methylobacterium crusticola TaxID=1697972 RepID=UPI001396CF74|nr:TonB-dependent siderophore receptor [Methylobacterium crusticola]